SEEIKEISQIMSSLGSVQPDIVERLITDFTNEVNAVFDGQVDGTDVRIQFVQTDAGVNVFFLEPNLDDEAWSDHLSLEAKERTDWRRLIRRVRSRRAWRKALSSAAEGVTAGPEDGMAEVMVATRAWWQMWDADLTLPTQTSRDQRFASRARGALAEVRKAGGTSLLLVLVEPRVKALLEALNEAPSAEVIVSYDDLIASSEEA
ncbi:MAG: hypothetical protein ACPGQO_07335, partial [Candidatus Poseidoniaceae archaeon]